MAEGKTITISQKGKKEEKEYSFSFNVYNAGTPITVTNECISRITATIEVNNIEVYSSLTAETECSIGQGQFGRSTGAVIKVKNGDVISFHIGNPMLITMQNGNFFLGELCQKSGNDLFDYPITVNGADVEGGMWQIIDSRDSCFD